MHGSSLIFSRNGVGPNGPLYPQRAYRVNPELFPQYTVLNDYFLPNEHELPRHGLLAQTLVFDFGFNDPSLIVGPMDTQFFPLTLGNNFLGLAITGTSDVPPSQNVVPSAGLLAGVQKSPAYLINIQQTHAGNTWQWMNKDVTNVEGVGTAENPLMFKRPVFLPIGDTVSCIVRNLANTSLRVQVVVTGGSF